MRCSACGSAVGSTARFCAQCGRRIDRTQDGPRAIVGDRRIVTALFADLVDYVRLVAEHDAEDVQQRVDAAFEAMAAAIRRYDGTVEKFIGDAVFAVFGSPRSHGDDALRAIRCALSVREALGRVPPTGGADPLQVRITLATGEVVAGRRDTDGIPAVSLTGPAVVTAARLQEIARPGEILADAATVHAARRPLAVDDRGQVVLRGQPQPVHVMAIEGEMIGVHWGRASQGALVGRAVELATLTSAMDDVVSSGRGRAIFVMGPAGVGKSRLVEELAGHARDRGVRWSWTDNVSYGTAEPYRFIRALAQQLADEVGTDSGSLTRRWLFTPDVDPSAAQRMAGAIAAVARDAEFSGWEEEAAFAPTDPAVVRAGVVEAAAAYTARMRDELGPRVIVIEDAHWIDRSSAEIMTELFPIWLGGPFLVIATTRAEAVPAWALEASPEPIDLAGLGLPETQELVEQVTGLRLDDDDLHGLHDRTAGNPLFVVETVRAGLEDGSLGERDGRLARVRPDAGDSLPLTLRSLLGARIDALDADGREVMEVAAVVGMTFATAVVAELLGRPIDPATLGRLEEARLVASTDVPDRRRFAHPLFHDVAYLGMLASRRRVLHGRLATLLAAQEPRVGVGVVALQWAAAGDRDRAVPLLVQAAEEAQAIGAPIEAGGFWRAAADLLGDDPRALELRRRAAVELDST